jgi:hypothetical protein
VSSCMSYSGAKGPGASAGAFTVSRILWHIPYLERVQWVLEEVPRGPVGPPGPLELAALALTVVASSAGGSAIFWRCVAGERAAAALRFGGIFVWLVGALFSKLRSVLAYCGLENLR